jgi:prolyl oligopeptidase
MLAGADNAKPPIAPVRNVVDEYYGTKVDDPYRYMENLQDPQAAAWFKAQAAFTEATLETIPGGSSLLARIEQLDATIPAVVTEVQCVLGDRVFYQKRLASENTFKLYVGAGFAGPERLLVDPDTFAQKPTEHMALSWWKPSSNGHYVAYGISPAGSEAAVLYITDVNAGTRSPEAVDRCQFGGVARAADNHSFVYNRLQRMQHTRRPPTSI